MNASDLTLKKLVNKTLDLNLVQGDVMTFTWTKNGVAQPALTVTVDTPTFVGALILRGDI